MLAAGRLSERVCFERRRDRVDELQGADPEWIQACDETWAAVEAITGREVHAAQQLHSVVTLRVVVRKDRHEIDPTWRVRWCARILSIEAVLPHPDRDRVTLLCSDGLNRG